MAPPPRRRGWTRLPVVFVLLTAHEQLAGGVRQRRLPTNDACEAAPVGSYPNAANCSGFPAHLTSLLELSDLPADHDGLTHTGSAVRRQLAAHHTFVKHKHDGHGDFALSLSQILFVVMASNALPERALWVSKTWCSYNVSRCIFVADKPICERDGKAVPLGGPNATCLPTLEVAPRHRPRNCCRRDSFFCDSHRQATLRAQYRFLPALLAVKQSPALHGGGIRWVVMVDDDSWVFPSNLLDLLKRFPHQLPLYIGDFAHTQAQLFACGGGGSVMSAALIERMDIGRCIVGLSDNCMQSDWMIAYCVAHAKGQFITNYGCDTCKLLSKAHIGSTRKRLRQQCFFMQNAGPFMAQIRPATNGYPAIVHAYRATTKRTLWRYHTHTDGEGRWLGSPPASGANLTAGGNGSAVARAEGGNSDVEGAPQPQVQRNASWEAEDADAAAQAGGAAGAGAEAMPVPEMTDALLEQIGRAAHHEGALRVEEAEGGAGGGERGQALVGAQGPLEQLRLQPPASGQRFSPRAVRLYDGGGRGDGGWGGHEYGGGSPIDGGAGRGGGEPAGKQSRAGALRGGGAGRGGEFEGGGGGGRGAPRHRPRARDGSGGSGGWGMAGSWASGGGSAAGAEGGVGGLLDEEATKAMLLRKLAFALRASNAHGGGNGGRARMGGADAGTATPRDRRASWQARALGERR